MISITEAKNILSENIRPLGRETLPVMESDGRILAHDIISPIHVPSFDNAAMDGYALNYDPATEHYRIVSRIPAGDRDLHFLHKGEAARIFTGAAIPDGADTVIQQELVTLHNDHLSFGREAIRKGINIRLKGGQCRTGEIILKAGSQINPGSAALLSSVGMTGVDVVRTPAIKVILTGDELTEPGNPLEPGKIYNSNGTAINLYLRRTGMDKIEITRVGDDFEALKTEVRRSLETCDVLLLSGGISVGEYDFVSEVLASEGVDTLFYKVRQKPGKPMFAGKKGHIPVFALPGNPAAILSCLNQYVKPSLLRMAGHKNTFSPSAVLPLMNEYHKPASLAHILKVKVTDTGVKILDGQLSFNLLPFGEADGFAVIYEEETDKKTGEPVEIYNW